MKKNRLPLFTFAGISFIVLVLCFIAFKYTYNTTREELLQTQLQSGQREAREIGKLLEQQLKSGLSKDQVIHNLQSSILNTDVQTEFICMYNKEGVELCHPNPALVGQIIDSSNSLVTTGGNSKTDTFLQWLKDRKDRGGIRSFPGSSRSSEIVNIYPVEQTDWMVALHVNIQVLTSKLSNLYTRLLLIFLVSALILIAGCYMLVRFIYNKYERRMEGEKDSLTKEKEGLALLNQQLNTSQERLQRELMNIPVLPNQDAPAKGAKKRIVTYQRDELIKLDVDNIAFVFLRNGITYLHTFDGASYTTNDSLDDLMKDLEGAEFYRANRQVIVNIRAIKTIQLFGNNQLKIITEPPIGIEILISKNKAADFRQWLNQ